MHRIVLSLAFCATLLPSVYSYHNPPVFSSSSSNNRATHIFPASTSTTSTELTVIQIPEQVRLTFTQTPTEMGVYWVTSNSTGDDYVPTVNYGVGTTLTDTATGTNSNYTAFKLKSPSLHFVTITNLKPNTLYSYQVGDPSYGYSILYNFTTAPPIGSLDNFPISFLAYGDMGVTNSQHTANFTAQKIRNKEASYIVHAGDISYADDRASLNNGTFYEGILNDFYNEVMISSAYAGYMMSSGNHESILDFLAYRERVAPTVPTVDGNEFYYSWNYGPIHHLAFDMDQPYAPGTPQYEFIVNDLMNVNRTLTPWVVAYNHFPFLCSNYFWCPEATKFRSTFHPIFNNPATKVDIFLAGHVHAAEIVFPNFNGTVTQYNFSNVRNMLEIMVGFPGDMEVCCNTWYEPQPDYSFWREGDGYTSNTTFGFTQVTVANLTHVHIEIWSSLNQTVIKDLWVSREYPLSSSSEVFALPDVPKKKEE